MKNIKLWLKSILITIATLGIFFGLIVLAAHYLTIAIITLIVIIFILIVNAVHAYLKIDGED